jgi:uncharacterized protein (TIGR02246 family)
MKTPRLLAILFLAGIGHSCTSARPMHSMSDADRAEVVRITREYRDAWLANDSERVMGTLTHDAVLVPAGMAPIQGEPAIRNFWFAPAGTTTTVTRMEQDVTDVIGDGDAAVVTGRGSVTFQVGGSAEVRTQHHWFANVLTRQGDGRWLIRRRMWVDLARR